MCVCVCVITVSAVSSRFEALGLQGLPFKYISSKLLMSKLNHSSLITMAGNSFNNFAVLPVIVAFFACATVPQCARAPEPETTALVQAPMEIDTDLVDLASATDSQPLSAMFMSQ